MINYGPVDVLVVALGEPQFDGSILAELERQAAAGAIRVLDAMVLLKQADGRCDSLDIEDLPADMAAAVGFIETGTRGLFDSDDSSTLFEGMVPGSAVIALAIENTWTVGLVNAIAEKGAEVALHFRVPALIIDEALASLPVNE
jgi:hypothetical protein